MLASMYSRLLAVCLGLAMLGGVAACGSSAGTGAAPQTTVIKLGLPSYATAPPILTSTTPPITVLGQVGTVAGEQSYTVVKGDVVVNIAKKFCITPNALALYNAWPEGYSHPIAIGDPIRIPGGSCIPGTANTTVGGKPGAPSVTTTTVPGNFSLYTVQKGDVLAIIAKKTGFTVAQIVSINGWLDQNHVIYVGLKIKLPGKTTATSIVG